MDLHDIFRYKINCQETFCALTFLLVVKRIFRRQLAPHMQSLDEAVGLENIDAVKKAMLLSTSSQGTLYRKTGEEKFLACFHIFHIFLIIMLSCPYTYLPDYPLPEQ